MNALLQWFTSSEWTLSVKALLHTLWQGAIIAITLGLAMRRVANPANRYRLSFGALASVMLIAVLTWAWLNRPEPDPGVVAATPAVFVEQPPPVISDGLPPIVVTAIRQESKPAPAGWTAWLALVWLAGAAAMLGRVGFQVAGAERLRRSTRPLEDSRVTQLLAEAQRAVRLTRKIRVAVTDRLTSPAVVGVIVPTLILPLSLLTALTPEQLRFVLLHELAHIRRGDYFANLFQLFMEALLFFNPAVWWISHQVRREREACCDALAIELSGAPVDYAKTLVQVAENILDNAPAAAPAFGGTGREPSQLADRVQRLLVPGYRPALRLTWRSMLVALLAGGALLFLSALGARNVVGAVTNNANESAVKSEDKSGVDEQITFTRPGDSTNITVNYSLNGKSPLEFTYPFLRTNRTQQSNGSIVTLNGLDSFATSELDPSVGMNSWKVIGRDQLQRQWFWYRTAPSLVASVSTTNAVVSSPFGVETDLSKHLGLGSNRSDVILSGSLVTVMPSYLNSSNVLESTDKAEIEIEGGNAVRDLEGRLTAVINGVRVKLTASGLEFTADSVQFNPITGNMIAAGNIRAETKDGTRIQSGNVLWLSETNNAGPKQRVRLRIRDDQDTQFPAPTPIPPQPEPSINKDASSSANDPPNVNSSARQTAAMATRTYAVGPMELARALGMTGSQVATNATQNSSKSVEVTNSATSNQRRISERTVTLTDGASTAQVNPDSEPGVSTWTVDGEDQLYQDWFRYRAGTNKAGPDESFPKVLDKGRQDVLQGLDPWGNPYIIGFNLNQRAVAGITNSSTRTIAADSNALSLFTRTFKVDVAVVASNLRDRVDLTDTNAVAAELVNAFRKMTANEGVDWSPPKTLFIHDRRGEIYTRATLEDIDKVERVLQKLNTPPPQINIKAWFYEISGDDLKVIGIDWFRANAGVASVTGSNSGLCGVLTEDQFKIVQRSMEQRGGVKLLFSSEVTTLSGRQAQIIGDTKILNLTNGINPQALRSPGISIAPDSTNRLYLSNPIPIGPVLDVIPQASFDEFTIKMTLYPTITEFLGYDKSEDSVEVYIDGKRQKASRPLPRFRVRQSESAVVIWDGQTVVLGGLRDINISVTQDGKSQAIPSLSSDKQIIIFVSATLKSPDGTSLHKVKELPKGIPPQEAPDIKKGVKSSFNNQFDVRPAVKRTAPLATRTYAVGPMELARALGMTGPSAGTNAAEMVHALLANAGVDLKPPRSVVFKDSLGLLMVHATEDELDAIEKLLVQANRDVPSSKPPTEKVSDAASLKPVPMKNPKVVESDNSTNLNTRTFSVDGEALLKVLYRQLGNNASPGAKRPPEKLSSEVRELFSGLGMDLQPPKAVFFNGDNGKLLVRATQKDMDFIESVIEVVNYQPPQVNISAVFVEVPKGAGADLYLGNMASGASPSPKNSVLPPTISGTSIGVPVMGILTEAQRKVVFEALKSNPNATFLSSPAVTTLSGRQAQIQTVDIRTVVNGINPRALKPPGVSVSKSDTNELYQTQAMPFGPVLDVIPYLSADGYTVQMSLMPTVTEFLGYDKSTNFVEVYIDGKVGKVAQPLPHIRVRQTVTTVNVWDGQTVVLSGFNDKVVSPMPDGSQQATDVSDKSDKQLLLFVTPTVIDAGGNRIYPGVGVDGPNF